jgi:hypothetical protein
MGSFFPISSPTHVFDGVFDDGYVFEGTSPNITEFNWEKNSFG